MVFVNVIDVCFIIVVFKYIKCVSVIVVVLLVIIVRVCVNSYVRYIVVVINDVIVVGLLSTQVG